MIKSGFILVVLICLFGCNGRPSSLSYSKFMEYIYDEDNGLLVIQDIDKMKYTMLFEPLKQKLDYNKLIGKDTTAIQASKNMYFKMRVELQDKKDVLKNGLDQEGQFFYRLQYLNTNIQKDFELVDGDDTLQCLLTNYEYTEGLTPYVIINISMPKISELNPKNEKFKIIYNDQLWDSGPVNFTYLKEDLTHIPTIRK